MGLDGWGAWMFSFGSNRIESNRMAGNEGAFRSNIPTMTTMGGSGAGGVNCEIDIDIMQPERNENSSHEAMRVDFTSPKHDTEVNFSLNFNVRQMHSHSHSQFAVRSSHFTLPSADFYDSRSRAEGKDEAERRGLPPAVGCILCNQTIHCSR